MLTDGDYREIVDAIGAAELKTSGEIVCVLARSSSDYRIVPLLWAVLVALASPWPMILLTNWSVSRIFLLQILAFLTCAMLLSLPGLRSRLVPASVKRSRAHGEAIEQFHIRGLSRTRARHGLLIFVSLEERYARIVTDEAIAAVITNSEWQTVVDGLVSHLRKGGVVPGFVGAIHRCGEILAPHFPPGEHVDELPDRIYVI